MKPTVGKGRPRYAGKVVAVRWDDASHAEAQFSLADIAEGFVVTSYGMCIRETRKGLTVTMDVPECIDQYRHSTFVPWAMIRSVKVHGTESTVARGAR